MTPQEIHRAHHWLQDHEKLQHLKTVAEDPQMLYWFFADKVPSNIYEKLREPLLKAIEDAITDSAAALRKYGIEV